jgi:predicted GNAT family acetyltransferase
MDDIKLNLNEKGHGAFYIMDGAEQMGEMVVGISGNNLTVYHTEVSTKAEGQGLAKKLLSAMVEYARSKELKVIPLCPYVHLQFKRHSDEYKDIWNKDAEEKELS